MPGVWLSISPLSVFAAALAYLAWLAFYRLFLHDLANVPGPKIAALTGWYEFYWDCLRMGRFYERVREMHQKHGPIVRINPWEVHIDDPVFYDPFYTNNTLDKDAWFYNLFGDNLSAVGTAEWELHKARRGSMAKFFSNANIGRLEAQIRARVQKLLNRIEEHRLEGKVVDLSSAFRSLATDVISDYAAPHTRDYLDLPDFAAKSHLAIRGLARTMIWHRHIPIFITILDALPPAFVEKFCDPTGAFVPIFENREEVKRQAQTVVKNKGVPQEKQLPTVLDAIYNSSLLEASDKTVVRMIAETQAVLGAGTETIGNTLSVLTYHVLAQPEVLKRLKAELQTAAANRSPSELMDFRTLERLPYLQASIKEALRLSVGVTNRSPRVHRTDPISYTTPSGKNYTFPPNTTVSMSILDMHWNEDIFSNAKTFNPDRWLQNDGDKLQQMERAFVPFGRGMRQCLGLDLAKEELTLMMGNLLHQFDLELFETTESDVAIVHDFFVPYPHYESKGVRVVAK